jgi:hypothetical protein
MAAGDVRINPTALAAFVNGPNGGVAKDLLRRGVRVEGEAKRLAHQPGTGRTYVRSNPRRVHRASAPGKPFATDLGTAAASIGHALGHDARGIFVQVGSGLRKFRWLELGTRRMAPRPTLRPALRKAR